MTVKNLGLAACITVWTYLLLTLFLGDRGLVAYAGLTAYREQLETRIEELSRTRERLASEAVRLQSDQEQIRLESRRIGYVRPEEGLIRIPGRTSAARPAESPGEKSVVPHPWRADRNLLRVLALSSGLLALFLLQTIFRASK